MGLSTDNDQSVYTSVYRPRKTMIIDNFLGGLAWSLGTIIGGSLALVLLGFILKFALRNVHFVPLVGNYAHDIIEQATKNQPALLQPTPSPTPTYHYPVK